MKFKLFSGLLQQLQILEGMQRILTNKENSNPT